MSDIPVPQIFLPKKPPVFTWTPTPTFNSAYEKQKFWEAEKKKWVEGWNHLTGTHYHYLKEQKIKDRVSGKIIRPIGRESDMLIHEEVRECIKLKQPSGMFKCRGIGLSSLGGGLANYFMRVHPGSTSLITSADQPRISKLYTDKIEVTNNNYHPDIRYRDSKFNTSTSKTYLQLEVKYLDEYNDVQVGYSDLFCNQTNDSDSAASSFSGTGAKFGFYDEIALNKRRKKLLQSSVECYRNQLTGELDGFLLCGGTVEDTLSNEEITEMWNLIKDADAYEMRVLFIPYSWKFCNEDGYIDFEKAELWWNKQFDRLSKLEDQSHLTAFLKNNPRTIDDIFNMAKGGFFEDDVADKVKLQLDQVRKDKTIIEVPHVIKKNEKGEYEAKAQKSGKIFILEHPVDGVEYVSTVDGVASGKKTGGENGSRVASIIWKMFDPKGYSFCPSAFYLSRPNEVESSYIYTTEMCHYFNIFDLFKKIAAEGNAGTSDHFSTYLKKESLGAWILYSKDLTGKKNTNTGKPFQYVNDAVRDWQVRQFNIFLRKYIQNIRMPTILEDYLKGKYENADLRDSSLMFPVYTGADFDKPAKRPTLVKHKRPHIIMGADGSSKRIWK